MSKLLEELAAAVGSHGLITGSRLGERSNGYWDSSPLAALALVMPSSTAQLQQVVKSCHHHRQQVVVQGGLTGAAGGQKAGRDEVAVSLERLNTIDHFDPAGKTLVAGAGCTLEEVQGFAETRGLLFPVDIGARGSCTIGGNIATNAGGMEVIRYGMMREQVLGLEVVLADGSVLSSMNQMAKNNAGYDLKQLFIGSEGTLGIVTRAVLRLRPATHSRETALVACNSLAEVIALLDSAQAQLGETLTRFEVMDGPYYGAQTGPGGHRRALAAGYGWYVLVEARGTSPERDAQHFQGWLDQVVTSAIAADAVVPGNSRQLANLWQIREAFDGIIADRPCFLYDVSLPIANMASYVEELRAAVHRQWPSAALYTLGHMGDGNLHFFLSPRAPGENNGLKSQADNLVYRPLAALGGSVSAEHGIGMDKKPWLSHSRSEAEIAVMKRIKTLLDPHELLNRGRIFDLANGSEPESI
jgi:FAD/FMN-containing dehydrogenase